MSPTFTVSAPHPSSRAPYSLLDSQIICFLTSSGDKVLIQEVLFDAVVTAPLEAYWTSLVLNKSEFVFFGVSCVI